MRRTTFAMCALVAAVGGGVQACSDDGARSEPDLTGAWLPQEVNGQRLQPGFDPGKAAIEFASDGTWQARDGCHPLRGTYELDGNRFDGGAVTKGVAVGMGCPHGEVAYGEVLPRVSRVEHSGDTLQFLDGDGDAILELIAQS